MLTFLFISGLTLIGWLWRRQRFAVPKGGGWAFDFCIGSALWSYSLFLLNCAGVPISRASLLGVTAVLVAGSFVRRSAAAPTQSPGADISMEEIAALIIIGIGVVSALEQALTWPLHHWDALVIYGFKAQVLYYHGSFKNPAFFDASIAHPNVDYPLLVPYLEATLYSLLGGVNDRLVNVLSWSYWISWLGILWSGLALRISRPLAIGVIAAIAAMPGFFSHEMTNAVTGNLDIPLACYWTALLFVLLRGELGSFAPIPTAILMVGTAFTKPEGTPLVLLAAAVLVFRKHGLRSYRVWTLAGTAVVLAPWYLVRSTLPHNSGYYLSQFTYDRVKGLGYVLLTWLRQTLVLETWGLLWITTIIALLPWRRLRYERPTVLLLVVGACQFLIYLAAFCLTPFDLHTLLPSTTPRLLLVFLPVFVLAAVWRYGPERLR